MNLFSELTAVIIEDTPAKSAVLEEMLVQLGIEGVQSFETGSAGLQSLSNIDERCILFLDLMLPDINGQEILQRLATKRFKGFVVINSVCEPRIIKTAVTVAANSGIRLLGALEADYTSSQLLSLLERCFRGPRGSSVHADLVLLDKQKIHQAFDEDRIIPFYQPLVNIDSQKVVALECLARIVSEDGNKILSPASFFPNFIDVGFLDNLALRLYKKSLQTLNEPFFASSQVKLALNIEPSQLLSSSLPTTLHALTEHAEISPNRVIFELTEQSPIDRDIQLEAINILRLKGYDIAIDDFGSGHTNIENLHSIPFNRVKIDRQLLHNVSEDNFCQVAIDSILSMAEEVGAEVVFEGIENVDQLVYSSQHKNVSLQGYYLCEPLDSEQLIEWIRKSPYSLA